MARKPKGQFITQGDGTGRLFNLSVNQEVFTPKQEVFTQDMEKSG